MQAAVTFRERKKGPFKKLPLAINGSWEGAVRQLQTRGTFYK